jgi:A/G-specific adenine glycosylase
MTGTTADFTRRLRAWFSRHRRDLPWRLPLAADQHGRLDPYKVLVSEAMLQQTQVATVIPYFHRFLEQFPDLKSLAAADEQAVLRAWQGLGYYSRARNLQNTARQILTDFAGKVPESVEQLLSLPGIGRYTAGAIASIAFEQRAPILDGNVARVLCRIDAVRADPMEKVTREKLWGRAEEILPRKNIGDFNSALMELGALICTPKSPQCLLCPVNVHCQAYAAGLQEKIPKPKVAGTIPTVERWTFCIRHADRYLVEQRPPRGRWAGMWQFATLEPAGKVPSSDLMQSQYGVKTSMPILLGQIEHALTHRRYRFHVFGCESREKGAGHWVSLSELNDLPMSKPHLLIRQMLDNRDDLPRAAWQINKG